LVLGISSNCGLRSGTVVETPPALRGLFGAIRATALGTSVLCILSKLGVDERTVAVTTAVERGIIRL
jgi:hypothetical protein